MALRAITPVPITSLPAATTPLSGTEVVAVVQSGTTSKVAVSDLTAGRAISATAATLSSGNLTFSSTAQRITGDFSNATVANRLMFQTSTTNGNTTVAAIPNGTSQQGQFTAFNASNPTNASNISIIALAGEGRVQSAIAGTGTYLPMTFLTGGSERVRIDTSGNVGIGISPSFSLDVYRSSTTTSTVVARNDTSTTAMYATNAASFVGTTTNTPFGFITNNTEQLRILATGGITSANLADAVGYKGTPLNEQSTAYTLVIGDQGKSIVHPISDNNARTFTIPANGSVAYPVGTTITFINMINTLTISINTDTMYLAGPGTTGSRTLAAYGMATAVKLTSTTWIISGNGLT